MKSEELRVSHLKNYAFFLYQNHLDDITEFYQKKIKETHFSKDYFSKFSPQIFLLLSQKEMELFIKILMKNRTVEEINSSSHPLNTKSILGIPIDKIKASDVTLFIYNRNQSLYLFLSQFSKDVKVVLDIIQEIEKISSLQGIKLFKKISKRKRKQKNDAIKDNLNIENSQLDFAGAIVQAGNWQIKFSSKEIEFSDEIMFLFGFPKQEKFTLEDLKKKIINGEEYLDFLSNLPKQKETSREFYSHAIKIITPNGEIRDLISQDYPVIDDNGNTIGLKSIIQDFTEIKFTEEKLRETLWQMQKILQYSPTYINIYDLEEDKLVYSNNAGRKLFGRDRINLYSNKYSLIMDSLAHPEDRKSLDDRFKNFHHLKDNEFDEIEFRLIDLNGNSVWFYSRGIVFKRVNGKVKQILLNAINITERKKAEVELKYLSNRLKEAQKIGNVGSFDWDIVNDVLIYSEEAYRIYNLPLDKKKFNISDFKAIVKHDDIDAFEKHLNNSLISGSIYEYEYKVILPDKTLKDIIARAKIIRGQDGRAVKLLGTIADITSTKKSENILREKNKEIKKANRKLEESEKEIKKINSELEERIRVRTLELKKSEERYRAFIRHSSEGIYRYELEGIPYIDTTLPFEKQLELIFEHSYFAECNDSFSKLYGINSAKELIGKKIKTLFDPYDPISQEVTKQFILSGYRLLDYDTKIITKNNEELYIRRNIIGIVEENKLLRTWGTHKDITERVKALDALKSSEAWYRFLADNVPQIFWTAHPEGGADFYNKKWYEYTGSTFEQARDWGWQSFIHPDDVQRTIDARRKSFITGEIFQTEFRLKRADGIYKWHLGRALPFNDNEGKILKWMGTVTDIDEQKRYSEELKQKNDLLIRINTDLDNFIYTASHDLKAPISNIEGLLSTLQIEMSDLCKSEGDVSSILSLMDSSVNKFKKTILDLTEITHAQKSGEEAVQENLVSEVLDEVKTMVDDLIKVSEVEIKTDFNECPTIMFSRRNFKSIIYNLLSNAIKYRSLERKPWVFIKTQNLDDYILLSVEDNGLGFDNSQIPKVFSMFKRLHAHIEGSGVGLYIVKRIITNAGGKIEAESKKGKGSIFKIYFKKNK